MVKNWIVDRSTARDFTVHGFQDLFGPAHLGLLSKRDEELQNIFSYIQRDPNILRVSLIICQRKLIDNIKQHVNIFQHVKFAS
jgi:vacuolar-type H+-ATPase subunit F/Vma7